MNKDVIYIEPEDDITDIIDRVKSAEQKVVAIVPPKKLGVLRSAVNNKLIAKAAKQSDKAVVMVTADPSLSKIAISAGIPVAKTLQSRPTMPGEPIPSTPTAEEEEIIEDSEEEPESEPATLAPATTPKSASAKTTPAEEETIDSDSITDEVEDSKKSKKDAKPIPKFEKYRKWIILGSVAGVALICFLVWALVFAPAAKIVVSIKTAATNFSEDVTLTNGAAKVESGVFKLEKQEIKNEDSVEFQATGEKDVGEKATGSLLASYYFGTGEKGRSVSIANGTTVTLNGLNYTVTKGASLTRSSGTKECDNSDDPDSIADYGCKMSMTIDIQAASSGSNYNVDASHTGWAANTSEKFYISNPSAISGGTSKVIKVVQASDVAAARQKLEEKSSGNADLKDKLLKQFSSDTYVIDSSYTTSISDPVSSPAVGEEASSGSAKLSTTATATLYGVDKTAISEYINKVAGERLPEDQKIYNIGEPFFEKFLSSGETFSAKLKTVTHSGPKVTEQEVMEKSKGRKIGEVQTLLRSINGVSNVSVEKSVFWMGSIPNDENKISIEMTVEDQ